MKRFKFFIVFLIMAIFAVLVFWNDLAGLYMGLSLKLPQIEKGVFDLVQKVGKQVFTPEPLRLEKEAQKSFLTQEGVIFYTNTERANNGLLALKESLILDRSARAKVEDMFKNQYFAHNSPGGFGVSDLAESSGYDYLIIGENLALGNFENDQALLQAWMDSPGHRANILNENYQEIGVWVQQGIYEGEKTWLAVQHFGKPVSACSEPNPALKYQIETSQKQLIEIQNALEVLRAELQSMSKKDRENYNQKVEQYNDFISQYNGLAAEIKNLIVAYNEQVKTFNSCASGN
jgi:uncharacterized protein YkwD